MKSETTKMKENETTTTCQNNKTLTKPRQACFVQCDPAKKALSNARPLGLSVNLPDTLFNRVFCRKETCVVSGCVKLAV